MKGEAVNLLAHITAICPGEPYQDAEKLLDRGSP
jgi:hypothetical protein